MLIQVNLADRETRFFPIPFALCFRSVSNGSDRRVHRDAVPWAKRMEPGGLSDGTNPNFSAQGAALKIGLVLTATTTSPRRRRLFGRDGAIFAIIARSSKPAYIARSWRNAPSPQFLTLRDTNLGRCGGRWRCALGRSRAAWDGVLRNRLGVSDLGAKVARHSDLSGTIYGPALDADRQKYGASRLSPRRYV